MRELKFSDISQKTPDMYSASSAYIGDVSKRADQEPTAVPDNSTLSSSLSFLSPVVFSPPGFLFAFNGWIPPVSGRICPPASRPTSQNLHPLEQSSRLQAAQRPNLSSDWEDCPAETGILEPGVKYASTKPAIPTTPAIQTPRPF